MLSEVLGDISMGLSGRGLMLNFSQGKIALECLINLGPKLTVVQFPMRLHHRYLLPFPLWFCVHRENNARHINGIESLLCLNKCMDYVVT